jgi:prophage regulatory protein
VNSWKPSDPDVPAAPAPVRMLRIKEVVSVTGLKPEAIYRLGREGKFPRPVKISEFSSGWVESEVQGYLASRIEARNADSAHRPFNCRKNDTGRVC